MKFSNDRVRAVALLPIFLFLGLSGRMWAGDFWSDTQRPFRVAVTLPKKPFARERVFGALPLDFGGDLWQLGINGAVDAASLRLVRGGVSLPVQVRDGRVEWADQRVPAGQEPSYALYFRIGKSAAPTSARLRIPDYASDTYGHPWDFADSGSAGIDSWGNRPEFIRHTVEDGLLKLDIEHDAYFVWGAMWGPPRRTKRPVRIDLARYPVLEIRVKQSVAHAKWVLYGRPEGKEELLRHEFYVGGTQWQTVRVDLARTAGWQGILTAFRIDPGKEVKSHVEIQWVRLTPLEQARREAVQLERVPRLAGARVAITLTQPKPRVGSRQLVSVRVADTGGNPVAGQPVLLALKPGSGGSLDADRTSRSLKVSPAARRALTNSDGTVAFQYTASPQAGDGAEELVAAAEFSGARDSRLAVSPQAGPPHHYVVGPARPQVVRAGASPLGIEAHLADEFDNRLAASGRTLTWTTDGGTLTVAEPPTGDTFRVTFTGDPMRRWAAHVAVRDNQGLAGTSAAILSLPTGPRPDAVRLMPNGYFAAGDKPWLPLGGFYANWVGLPTPDGEWDRRQSFTDASDEQIVAWLTFLKANGVTAERFMLRTHRQHGMEPMDIGGRVNPALFAAVMHYLDLARPFGFKFLLVLHEDYSKPCYFDRAALETFCLPWFAGEDLDALPECQRRFIRDRNFLRTAGDKYTDPDAIACQDRYARTLIGLLKDHPLVFAYELENEMVNCPADWANHALATVRSVDPQTPLCVSHGGGGLETADPAWWKAKTAIDFYTYHLYPHGTTSPSMDYGLATDVLTRYGRMGKPAFLGESSGDQFSYGPERELRRWTMRDLVWFSLVNGNPGCFFWNARGSELAEFKLAHEIAARIDWRTFQRKRPAIAVRVPHPLEDDRWFRSPPGREALTMMARYAQHYLDRGVDFDFALDDAASYAARADVAHFAPPEPMAADFGISPGYQLASLVRADNREALVYVRNFAGVKLCETGSPQTSRQYLRQRRPVPLQVSVGLPGRWQADVWDLDTARHQRQQVESGGRLELGPSDHDFAIHWHIESN